MTDIEVLRERAKKIKLFASDLDGTLLDTKHLLSDETRRALVTLSRKGIIVVVSTGRSRFSIPETVTSVEGLKYLITANGSKLFINGTDELIFEKYLSAEALDSVAHFFSDPEVLCEVFWDGVPHVESSKYNNARDYGIPMWFSDYFFLSRKPIDNFIKTIRENEKIIENISFVVGTESVKDRVWNSLLENSNIYELTSAFPFKYEIGSIGVSKGAAVDFIAKREGVLPEETICFGDYYNDLTMIEYAGIGIAVGNAASGIIAAADYVTDDNDNEGVVSALKTLGMI